MPYRTVTILAEFVPEYRLAFFDGLRTNLKHDNIDLRVIYGRPFQQDDGGSQAEILEWGMGINNRVFRLSNKQLIWQPCLKLAAHSDLVITEQASRLVTNHVLFALHRMGRVRLGFWGHGKNLRQHAANRLGEAIKAFESKRVHWWFAYTALTVELLQAMGFPSDRITLVENTIDVHSLEHARARLTPADLATTRKHLGLKGTNCALYIGGMYPEKRLPFLLEAAGRIRTLVPDFELLLVGAGADDNLARDCASKADWIHYLGPQSGEDKVRYFALCKLLLLPGLVGLAIVDSFALRLPMLTIDVPYHSPEIAYLRNHENGVMLPVDATPGEYAQAAVTLLRDEGRRQELIRACAQSAHSHGMKDMITNFSEGVRLALAHT